MDRINNWSPELVLQVGKFVGLPFVWGETDCASLLRKVSVCMYGEDIFGGPSKYKTAKGAIRAYKGLDSIDDLIIEAGGVEIPQTIATDGDVAVEQEVARGFQTVYVKVGSRWLVSSEVRMVVESVKEMPNNNVKVYRF